MVMTIDYYIYIILDPFILSGAWLQIRFEINIDILVIIYKANNSSCHYIKNSIYMYIYTLGCHDDVLLSYTMDYLCAFYHKIYIFKISLDII